MDCCETDDGQGKRDGFASRVLRYAYVDMMDDLAETLLLGLALAALAAALLPDDLLGSGVMTGPGAYLLMLVVGIPLYVCASASTPIAAALIAQGLSPGAALVFLLAGTATNPATLAVLKKTLGGRAAVVHIVVLSVMTVTFGWLVDADCFSSWTLGLLSQSGEQAHQHGSVTTDFIGSVAAVLLLALITAALWRGAREKGGAAPAAS